MWPREMSHHNYGFTPPSAGVSAAQGGQGQGQGREQGQQQQQRGQGGNEGLGGKEGLLYERLPLPSMQGSGLGLQQTPASAFSHPRASDTAAMGVGGAQRKVLQIERQRQQQQQQQMVASLPLVGHDRSFLRRSQPQLPPPSPSYAGGERHSSGPAGHGHGHGHGQAPFSPAGATPQLLSAQQLLQERQQIMSAAHSGEQQSREALVLVEVEQLEELCRKELAAIEEFKKQIKSGSAALSGADGEALICRFRADLLNRLWKKKTRALSYICEGVSEQSVFGLSSSREQLSLGPIAIIQQPSDLAVVNRYILPSPKLHISSPPTPGCSFFVAARVVYSDDRSPVENATDGKQEMLQGIVRVPVDNAGFVLFNKIKVMEVTRKHKMRPFALEFSLEEMTNKGEVRNLASIHSMPFTVQSRPNKRLSTSGSVPPSKRSALPDTHRFSSGATRSDGGAMLLPVVGYDRSLPNLSIPHRRAEPQASPVSNTSSLLSVPTPESTGKARSAKSRSVDSMLDHYYIDITKLLVLPQKEAAKRLGISESMLCKRFKETTSRKWPYRYLRKIEKVISMLQGQQLDDPLSEDDSAKLKKLLEEKEECLQPVRIRITSYDKVIGRQRGVRGMALAANGASSSSNSNSSSTVPIAPKLSQHQQRRPHSAAGDDTAAADEEEMASVLQTMKSSRERLGAFHPAAQEESISTASPSASSLKASNGSGSRLGNLRGSGSMPPMAQRQGLVLPQPQSSAKLGITPAPPAGAFLGESQRREDHLRPSQESLAGFSAPKAPARTPPRLVD